MYLLLMVVDDATQLDKVLGAWVEAGVEGVTILESTGISRVLYRSKAQPVYGGFSQVFGSGRVGHNTLFAVIESMEVAEAAVAATEAVVGSMDNPDTGVIFVVPVARSWGFPKRQSDE